VDTDCERLSGARVALRLLTVAAAGAVVVGTILTTMPASASAVTTPTYVRTIGSPGEATMYPSGVAVDSAGNVYVADTGNYKIEKYRAGTSTLLWSVGIRGAPIGGGTDSFTAPRDLATDGTFVYVADTDDALVQVLHASDGSFVKSVRTFGAGQKVGSPIGISVGHKSGSEEILVSDGVSGNVYVFDTSFNLLLTIPPTARNEGTRDAATDSSGDIYTADYRGNKVDKYNSAGVFQKSWGTTSGCQDVAKPYGVDVDANNHVYVASSNLEQVKVFDANGNCLNVGTTGSNAIGTACKSPAVCAPNATKLFQLRRVAVGAGTSPLVYAADLWGLKILTYSSSTGAIASSSQPVLGNSGYPPAGGLNEPHGIAIAPGSNQIFVANTVNQRMDRLDLPNGTNPIDWGTKGVQESAAAFNWAQGVAFDAVSGNIWVANTRNNRIDEFGPSGTVLRELPTSGRLTSIFNWPMSVAFDPSGNMYVADTFSNDIQSFSVPTTGAPTLRWKVGGLGTGNGKFSHPWGVVYDPMHTRVLVVDTNNNRIVALNSSTGAYISTVASGKGVSNGKFANPEGIAVDAAGNIWVADTGNNRVEEFNSSGGFLQTFGSYGTSGTSSFNAPQGLGFDGGGLLYVADANNNRIQVFQP
jgi:tripartite motif-containing protein 71